MFNAHTNRKVQVSLLVLVVGLAWATVTDVHLNAPGLLMGVLSVVTTAVFQIWQGSKQREYKISGIQLQSIVAIWQARSRCHRVPLPFGGRSYKLRRVSD